MAKFLPRPFGHTSDEGRGSAGRDENFLDGAAYKVVEKASQGRDLSVRQLAVEFLVYGVLAEIFAKETGFHKGLGGPCTLFPAVRHYPNNAIVGGSGDISVGAALYKKINRRPGVVICNIGDGSLGCGPVWKA